MSAAQPLVLMMAGGTGGHVYPALAVAEELQSRGMQVEWVGTRRGLENRVVPAAGIVLHYLPVRGVRGKGLLDTLQGLLMLALSCILALWLVLRRAPRCVVGMGGYASGPAGASAWLLRKPLLIHEQNAVAGTTNRLLAPLARKIIAGFPGAFSADVEYEVLGNPVRRELIEAAANGSYSYRGQRPLRLLVLGGSLGSQPINQVVPGTLRRLLSAGQSIEIRHQAGVEHAAQLAESYAELLQDAVEVHEYIEDMASAYSWSDLVLCRAGALTVSELAVMGRPAVLVPLPHAIDDHQSANARSLTERGGGVLLPQIEMNEASLAALLTELLEAPAGLAVMAQAAADTALPEAVQQVCDRCEELIHAQ